VSAEPSFSIRRVMELMVERRVGRVVVQEGNEPVGIFTEQDVLRRVMNRKLDIHNTAVRRVMTTPIRGVPQTTPILDVLGKMYAGRFRHLLVRDDKDQMVGLVSMRRILELAVSLGTGLQDTRVVGAIMSGKFEIAGSDARVAEVIDRLAKERAGCVLVSDNASAAIQGIFTERDVLKKVAVEDRDMGHVRVSEVMTRDPIIMPESSPIQEVLTAMHANGFRHMPVGSPTGKVVGLVSMGDVLQYAKAFNIDDVVRKAWKEIEDFWESDEHYTPG
jgi:CBS domain-containing protein